MARKIEYPITFYGIESHGKTTALSRRAELYGGKYGVVFNCDVKETNSSERSCLGKLCYGKMNCQRLHREARCLRQLYHPNVISCYGIFAVKSPLYQLVLLMDYVDQRILDVLESLDDIAAHRTIPWMINHVLEAVRYIHNEQIDGRIGVHGNLNMNSIRVKEHLKRLALCDFAIASQETRSPTSFDYLAPELKKRITPIPIPESGAGQFVDIMCCGLVIKGMCLRKENVSPTDVVQPSEMNDLVNRCLRESHPVTINELNDNWREVEEKYYSAQREIPITPYGTKEGHYRFLSRLGKWPLSEIHGYYNRRPLRCYAAGNNGKPKEIACKIADSEDRREYLEHEATFLLENRNPNILKCYGLYTWSEDQGTVFMLTELFPQDLEKVLTSGTYEVDDMGGWMCEQLVNAVRFLHRETFEGRGAMHLDIKPENILVDMGEKRLVMCDFGTVRENKPCDAETGSEMYYAPEMFDMKGLPFYILSSLDGQAIDMWNCGLILKALMTKQKDVLTLLQSKFVHINSEIFVNRCFLKPEERPKVDSFAEQWNVLRTSPFYNSTYFTSIEEELSKAEENRILPTNLGDLNQPRLPTSVIASLDGTDCTAFRIERNECGVFEHAQPVSGEAQTNDQMERTAQISEALWLLIGNSLPADVVWPLLTERHPFLRLDHLDEKLQTRIAAFQAILGIGEKSFDVAV